MIHGLKSRPNGNYKICWMNGNKDTAQQTYGNLAKAINGEKTIP